MELTIYKQIKKLLAYSFWDWLRNFLRKFTWIVSWTNWVNSGRFKDNYWISCQFMVDMRKVYDDLIIINLYEGALCLPAELYFQNISKSSVCGQLTFFHFLFKKIKIQKLFFQVSYRWFSSQCCPFCWSQRRGHTLALPQYQISDTYASDYVRVHHMFLQIL